jgi:large subunit ribosomal protein L11
MKTIKDWDINYQEEKRKIKENPIEEKKKVFNFERIIDVFVPTVMAKSSPPFGPALAQYGVNVTNFCEAFNEYTEEEEICEDLEIPVRVYLRKEKTFEFICRSLPLIELIELSATWLKGEGELKKIREIEINKKIIYKLFELKNVKSGRIARKKLKLSKKYHWKIQKKIEKENWVDILDLYKIYKIQEEHLHFYPNYNTEGLLKTIVNYIKKEKTRIVVSDEIREKKEYIYAKYKQRKRIQMGI